MFGRKGDNLTVDLPVSYPEAALGANVEVPTLNGPVTLKVPAGTPNGKTFRVRGKGAPKKGGSGDLLVTVNVDVPDKLSREEKQLLKQLAGSAEGFPDGSDWGWRDGEPTGATTSTATIAPSTSSAWRRSSPACIRRPCGSTSRRVAAPEADRRATPAGTPTPTSSVLRSIQALTQDEGINLAGVKRIMEMRAQMDELRRRVEELQTQLAHRRAIAMTGRRTSGEMVPARTVIRMPWQGDAR